MSFDNFNLNSKILKAISEAGYLHPTEIQSKVMPKIMSGFDIRASAQTGTGKTGAFLLPILNSLVTPPSKTTKGPRILILVPTRELAIQITMQTEKYSKYLQGIKSVCIFGGVPYHQQRRKLSRPYDILIATPGRLIDFINQKKIEFPSLEMLVLDEADRMLDMGFIDPVKQIVAITPSSKQTLLFSATLQGNVVKLSEKLLKNPIDITIQVKHTKNDNIKQKLYYVDDLSHKTRLFNNILDNANIHSAIVFTATKRHADQLVKTLNNKSYQTAALHGDMNQRQRTRTITDLKNGKVKILIATDVAARGIDVKTLSHVINFDLPNNFENYVHRIGRTGRAGSNGVAISFVSKRDIPLVKKIEKFIGYAIDVEEIAGLEPRKDQIPLKSKRNNHSHFGKKRKFRPKEKFSQKRSF